MDSGFISRRVRVGGRTLGLTRATWPKASDPQLALDAVREALARNDIDDATAVAEEAVRAGAEHPVLLNLGAARRERAGDFQTALAWLQRAVRLAPGDFTNRNALGLCLQALGQAREALREFDAALACKPDFAPGHCNRGASLEALGDLKAAEDAYLRALELAPGHVVAVTGLASLANRFGEPANARELALQVLAGAPGFPPAVLTLAAAEIALGAPGAAEARLRLLLEDSKPSPLQKAEAMGLLGDCLDALGRTGEAFDAYVAAAAEQRRLLSPRFAGRRSALDTAEALAARLEQTPPTSWPRARHLPGRPGDPTAHVFLLGFARSATTLLEQALAGHDQVRTLGEQETLLDATAAYLGGPQGLDQLITAPEAELRPYREAYWRRVGDAGVDPSGAVFIDKHPFNSLRLPVIARLFPEARVLFAVRDPRDVVLSCLRRRFNINSITFDMLTLEGCARLYAAAMRIASRTNELARLRLHLVKHEQLTADFDSEVARICEFLGVRPAAGMTDFAGRMRERAVNTPSAAQLAHGLDVGAGGQWRRYADQLRSVGEVLAPWIERFGYAESAPGRRSDAAGSAGSGPRAGEALVRLGGRIGRSSRI